MAANEPIDPVVRLTISEWPDDAPRGAVSTFCAEHRISGKSFYELRKRVRADGQAAVLEPRSRRPRSSPAKLTDQVRTQAVAVPAALESSGLDHGPISVHDKMTAMGLPVVPSTAALARIFRESGVARAEPRKKPRAAWRRFVFPSPNACWQLIVQDDDHILVVDFNGEILLETSRPAPGVTYVGRLRGNRPRIRGLSPKS